MSDELITDSKIRDYLLGFVTDEQELNEIEGGLFSDASALNRLEIVEEELIEDYAANLLNGEELKNFEKLFFNNAERVEKIRFARALQQEAAHSNLYESKQKARFAFFRDWFLTPQFAGVALILVAISACFYWLYFKGDAAGEALADLFKIYETERPVEARIVDFNYSPFLVLRGEKKEKKAEITRQRVEKQLLEAVETNSNEKTHNALGVFYLTEKEFDKAIEQFESALKYDTRNAESFSNLGAAYFEKAKRLEAEKKLETLAIALEQTTKSVEFDPTRLEALFNRALILEEMNLPRKAIEVWQSYLQKDSDSRWAQEARKHLENLEKSKARFFKSSETIRDDFLAAFREKNEDTAWRIHSQTKEISTSKLLPYQFARNYLEARQNNKPLEAEENLSALRYIGDLEKNKSADFFFEDLADFYSQTNQTEILHEAHLYFAKGLEGIGKSDYKNAQVNFEISRDLFTKADNQWEKSITEIWIAHCLTRSGNINSSREILFNVVENAREKKYKWIEACALDWTATNLLLQNEYSKSLEAYKTAYKLVKETADTYLQQRLLTAIVDVSGRMGETSEALAHVSKNLEARDFYFISERQMWRDYIYASQIFNRLNLPDAAIAFGEENLYLGQEIFSGTPIIHNSYVSLAEMYKGKKNYEKALVYVEKSREAITGLEENQSKKILLLKTELEAGDIKRGLGNCEEAIRSYDIVIETLSQLKEQTFHLYQAHKGKLICFQTLGRADLVERELPMILEIFEKHRLQILEQQARNVFFDNEQTVYDIAIENARAKGDSVAAFEYAEKTKARSLLDLIKGKGQIAEQKLNFISAVEPLKLSEIQAGMPSEAQIVQFSVLPDKVLAWIITRDNFYHLAINVEQKILESKIEEFLSLLEKEKENPASAKESSAAVYEILIAPLLPRLDNQKVVFFIPDKILNRLSFASLYSKNSQKYLVEDFPVAYSPSASVFIIATEKALEKNDSGPEKLFAVGNPAFDRKEFQNLNDLKSAEREINQIADLYPESVEFTGENAEKSTILKNLAESEVFHFAGHYLANKTSPLNSKFLLAKKENESSSELKAYEIAAQKNSKLKLAVLSACETGVEKFYNGEGAVGVARFFLAIGVPSTVASFWKVDSTATTDLMTDFHHFRKIEKLPTIKALQKAQIKAIKSPAATTNAPFFWAGFAEVGGFTKY